MLWGIEVPFVPGAQWDSLLIVYLPVQQPFLDFPSQLLRRNYLSVLFLPHKNAYDLSIFGRKILYVAEKKKDLH